MTVSIFDLLEPLSAKLIERGGPDVRTGFARATGGVDLPWLVDTLSNTVAVKQTGQCEVRNRQHSSDLVGRLRAHVATYEDDDVVAEAADTIGELVEALGMALDWPMEESADEYVRSIHAKHTGEQS